jgi:CBS domain-containing protein
VIYQVTNLNQKPEEKLDHFNSTTKQSIESLIKKSITFDSDGVMSEILPKLDSKRSEIFTIKNNLCYFINNRIVLNKKKNNPSMRIDSSLQSIPYLKKTDNLAKAIPIFLNYKVNSIPVLNDKKIIGEIRILSVLEKMLEDNLASIMIDRLKPRYIKISSNKSISAARKVLKENQIDALPVEKDGKIRQIITSNDIVSILNLPQKIGKLGTIGKIKIRSLEMQIANIGTRTFPKCNIDESLESVVKNMLKNKQGYCVIASQSKDSFLIIPHDVLKLCKKNTRKRIPVYVMGDENEKTLRPLLSKLNKPLEKFSKSIDKIVEVRISIDNQNTSGLETKHNMELLILSTGKQYSFSSKTWSIEEGLSYFGDMISRKISSKTRKSNKSIRKTSKYEILANIGTR